MLSRIIYCAAVSLAVLAVILLATLSPGVHKKPPSNINPMLAMSLYIQQSRVPTGSTSQPVPPSDPGAYIFHKNLTEGPENTSRVVGKAQGFIIPIEHFAHSAFNIIYLSVDTPEYSGSLSIEARRLAHKEREELTVVGGTGSFAFARGVAVFAQTDLPPSDMDATYHVKLQLRFPSPRRTIPG